MLFNLAGYYNKKYLA